MILSEFAKFLQKHNEDFLLNKVKPIELLLPWIKKIIAKNPKTNVEKIIHKEILYCENSQGESIIIGKSESGRKLVSALIEFAKSYDNYNQAKWIDITEKALNQTKKE